MSLSKISFQVPNGDPNPRSQLPIGKHLTLKSALEIIEANNFEPVLRRELIARISRYPSNTMNAAISNLPGMISEINARIRQDEALREAPNPEPEAEHAQEEPVAPKPSRAENRPSRRKFADEPQGLGHDEDAGAIGA